MRGNDYVVKPKLESFRMSNAPTATPAHRPYHLTHALADAGDFNTVIDYGEMIASMSGYLSICASAGTVPASIPIRIRASGRQCGHGVGPGARPCGIIYPSVRHAGGTCIVTLRPNAVQSIVQGDIYRRTMVRHPLPLPGNRSRLTWPMDNQSG